MVSVFEIARSWTVRTPAPRRCASRDNHAPHPSATHTESHRPRSPQARSTRETDHRGEQTVGHRLVSMNVTVRPLSSQVPRAHSARNQVDIPIAHAGRTRTARSSRCMSPPDLRTAPTLGGTALVQFSSGPAQIDPRPDPAPMAGPHDGPAPRRSGPGRQGTSAALFQLRPVRTAAGSQRSPRACGGPGPIKYRRSDPTARPNQCGPVRAQLGPAQPCPDCNPDAAQFQSQPNSQHSPGPRRSPCGPAARQAVDYSTT